MQMPVFVPRDLWRWLFGPLTLPSMEEWLGPVNTSSRMATTASAPPWEFDEAAPPRPLHSPFFGRPRHPIDVEVAVYWSGFTDWALLPHVNYFSGAPELFQQLLDTAALRSSSARMKAFNEEQLVSVVDSWRLVAGRLAYMAQGS